MLPLSIRGVLGRMQLHWWWMCAMRACSSLGSTGCICSWRGAALPRYYSYPLYWALFPFGLRLSCLLLPAVSVASGAGLNCDNGYP